MVSITIELADNGIIKKITDDNHGGVKKLHQIVQVYEKQNSDKFEHTIKFLSDISEDLGLDCGNAFDKNVLKFKTDWGENFKPSLDDIDYRMKQLKREIEILKEWKQQAI